MLTSSEELGGVDFDDEDVGYYDFTTGSYSMVFDDSQMDNSSGFDAVAQISATEFLLSTDWGEDLPGMSSEAQEEDIVKCNMQTHQCEMYFDGSDVGLNDDINGLSVMPDVSLLLKLDWSFSVGGVLGNDYDVVKFIPISLGNSTTGTFSMFFDGSDVGVNRTISSVWYDAPENDLCLSFTSPFSSLSGVYVQDEDVICFSGNVYGPSTSGSWATSLLLDFSTLGNTTELAAFEYAPEE